MQIGENSEFSLIQHCIFRHLSSSEKDCNNVWNYLPISLLVKKSQFLIYSKVNLTALHIAELISRF